MTKLLIPVVLLAFFGGCLGAGCMPTEKSEQERFKQAQEADQARRAENKEILAENRKATEAKIEALSAQVTKEHTIQTPEKMDALAGVQAQFAAQAKMIADAAATAIANANAAADKRIADVMAANANMPKNPMGTEAWSALTVLASGIAGMFGVKLMPPKSSSIETTKALAALEAKVAAKPT